MAWRCRFSWGAAQVAGDDGEGLDLGIAHQIFLLAVGQGRITTFCHRRSPAWGHGFELATVEHVEEQSLEDVVTVMAKGDLGATQLLGGAIQNAAAQAGAERAGGLALRYLLLTME